ncbi:metallophosphoesterase family protein [Tunicatimonas pelagia]|uniref:metallophosphoesterase family protein n=1 Tax=Tunicatimonas pelagia TaxID=931531 RepID=UPI00266641C5|nr:exonuclease SbcCD subunit D [Tunicatimonas pelagia]WKN42950.1 exonuclease SbcCD subunit D [Tunicatimonas pelagia]
MKILHTADWHLGKRLGEYSRLPEQELVLDEICQISEREEVDVVLIAGDLFDTFHPGNDAAELLYRTVHRLSDGGRRAVVAIAGNHDSPDRVDSTDLLARSCGIIFQGRPNNQVPLFRTEGGVEVVQSSPGFLEIRLSCRDYPLRLLSTPYANELTLKRHLGTKKSEALREVLKQHWSELGEQHCNDQGVNILMAHLYAAAPGEPAPEEPEDEKPVLHIGGISAVHPDTFPEQVQYVALGHLHRHHTVGKFPCPIVYSGTPLSYSFSEAGQTKCVTLVEVSPGTTAKVTPVALTQGRPLIRKRFSQIDEALNWLEAHPNTFIELTLVSDTYIDAKTKKALYTAHSGIVSIIPEIVRPKTEVEDKPKINLQDNLPSLFSRYFEHKRGQQPNTELVALLQEVIEVDEI